MSAKSRKRSRAVTDENRADCPFTVSMVSTPSYEEWDHTTKKRKRNGPDDGRKESVQASPFEPRGKFKTHSNMDVSYTVEPSRPWFDMTRYNSFVLNNVKYFNEDFVYIANDATIERQKDPHKDADQQDLLPSNDYWVAKILEVRALDEHHVYARVYWMYSPDELPPNTLDNKKLVSGRQPYHGQNELIASNHMDIINVVSVAMRAVVNHWVESDDEQVQDALYWRQAFDCRTSQLSTVEHTCRCKTPANPDKTLVGCSNSQCEQWLHYECLLDDLLTRVYATLGTDKAHQTVERPVKRESDDTKDSLHSTTPIKIKNETAPTPSNDKDGANGSPRPVKRNAEDVGGKATASPVSGTPTLAAEKLSRSSSTKKGRFKRPEGQQPYEGLFEAKLRLDDGPTVWEVTDLRPNVSGGDRTWTEKVDCLVCGTKIE
ncbi:ebs-bah-phd domain-containing protein [Drechmeria coniospora]|uniref:Ebs-bah-phd domain-containing protein n=1 Tax=Drechmeria coniospora TaxID=98403 RepID=A0A151GE89_DRECN|nr:ebs-bah-phd domain-containing protein [Drechmeria coniospora]KYK55405.1 ebs-bah-phd domain-containing protein [Drechmeria coniospora]ODA81990.1 hypothetical protein RJ55_00495 [Drechmeria coniospora]